MTAVLAKGHGEETYLDDDEGQSAVFPSIQLEVERTNISFFSSEKEDSPPASVSIGVRNHLMDAL